MQTILLLVASRIQTSKEWRELIESLTTYNVG